MDLGSHVAATDLHRPLVVAVLEHARQWRVGGEVEDVVDRERAGIGLAIRAVPSHRHRLTGGEHDLGDVWIVEQCQHAVKIEHCDPLYACACIHFADGPHPYPTRTPKAVRG